MSVQCQCFQESFSQSWMVRKKIRWICNFKPTQHLRTTHAKVWITTWPLLHRPNFLLCLNFVLQKKRRKKSQLYHRVKVFEGMTSGAFPYFLLVISLGYTSSAAPPLSGLISCLLGPTQDARLSSLFCWFPVQDCDLLCVFTAGWPNCRSQRTPLPQWHPDILHKALRFVCNTVSPHLVFSPCTNSDFRSSHSPIGDYLSGQIMIPYFNFLVLKVTFGTFLPIMLKSCGCYIRDGALTSLYCAVLHWLLVRFKRPRWWSDLPEAA